MVPSLLQAYLAGQDVLDADPDGAGGKAMPQQPPRLEAGGWRLEAGGWRLEAGGWRLEGLAPTYLGSRKLR